MRLVVLGGGESGVGTAILGKKKGYDVFVSDYGKIKENYKEVLIINDIAWEEGTHTEDLILNADVVMKSPGIPEKKSAIVKKLIEKGIPIISEIEFATQFTKAITIGITGSNGKTTTTMLTYHLLKSAGLNVGLGGNIGKSFAWQVAEDKYDSYVLELSSFQLDGIIDYKPHIAIITNISPDHLDRYDYKYEKYIDSKFRITMNQTEEDFLIYDADDEAIAEWFKNNKTKAQLIPFSLAKTFEMGAFIKNKTMEVNIINETMALEGKHNMKNAMAATSVAKLMKIRNATIRESLSNFQGVEHRLEKVLKIQNVQYINDSKATNVNATFFALDSMNTPTVWIVGGVDKGNDYNELMSLVREKVKAIICLGVDNKKIIDVFGNVVDMMIEVDNMEDAVKMAQRLSEKGDTVLLSPACASFDLFENYEDRGNQFKQAVKHL
jgi:UDP-N-acetylmuramoylalanine--D-glutamate ligase